MESNGKGDSFVRSTKKRNINKKKKKLALGTCVRIFFGFTFFFYIFSVTYISSSNITLSVEEQKETAKLNKKQKQVDQLTSEVNILQEKSRVLGLLDDKVTDNQNNIYVITE